VKLSLFDFSARRVPYLSRASYVRELRTAATYPVAMALTEGAFASVVAQKYFNAGAVLVSIIVAAPMFGNIAALVWSDLAEGKPRIRFANHLQMAVAFCLLAVGLTWLLPKPQGAWLFALLMVSVRVLASGIVTIRSVVWRMNYPRDRRAQIVSRITVIATASMALASGLGAALVDRVNSAYVFVYFGAALLALVGMRQFAKVRIRGEGQLLRRERMEEADDALQGLPPRRRRPVSHLIELFADARQLLREDRQFRTYQRWQMLMGMSFLMMLPALYTLVNTKLTRPNTDYLLATVVSYAIPTVTQVVFTQIWAPIFDRIRFSKFRFIQSVVGLFAHALIATGALFGSLPMLACATFVLGVAQAAGGLAWNLGQNAFAPPDQVQRYMGVHVMLTGLRGFIAPFAGTAAFVVLGWYGWERYTFLIPLVVCALGAYGFYTMMNGDAARDIERLEPTGGFPVSTPGDTETEQVVTATATKGP
jgi:hypothetical protein